MALCGVAETPQINCHSWPFLSIFFLSPFAQFFLPLFLSLVHNWGSLYGLIKQHPPIGSLCFWSHFMRNACPCLNVLIVLIDVPVFCPPGLLKSKKFQNMEKKDSAYDIVLTIPPLNIFDYRHIAVWETRAMLLGEFHPFYCHSLWQKGM